MSKEHEGLSHVEAYVLPQWDQQEQQIKKGRDEYLCWIPWTNREGRGVAGGRNEDHQALCWVTWFSLQLWWYNGRIFPPLCTKMKLAKCGDIIYLVFTKNQQTKEGSPPPRGWDPGLIHIGDQCHWDVLLPCGWSARAFGQMVCVGST